MHGMALLPMQRQQTQEPVCRHLCFDRGEQSPQITGQAARKCRVFKIGFVCEIFAVQADPILRLTPIGAALPIA
jgi:hypothetical protein